MLSPDTNPDELLNVNALPAVVAAVSVPVCVTAVNTIGSPADIPVLEPTVIKLPVLDTAVAVVV